MYKLVDWDAINSLKDEPAAQKIESVTNELTWHYWTNGFVSRPHLLLPLPRGWGRRAWLRCDRCLWLNSFSFPFYLLFLFWNLIFAPSFLSFLNVLVSFAEPRSLVRTTDCKHSSGGSCPKFSKKLDAHNDLWHFVHVIDQSDFRIGKGISSACLYRDTG